MAANVFGSPITTAMLSTMPGYGENKTSPIDRAKAALELKNTRGNDAAVLQFVQTIGRDSGFDDAATLCVFYNATGSSVKLVTYKNWHGHVAESPYPITVENGQWAGFVHAKSGGASSDSGSYGGAVVYRAHNERGHPIDIMIAWGCTSDREYENAVCTKVSLAKEYDSNAWDATYKLLKESGLASTHTLERGRTYSECSSSISTGTGPKAIVEAVFSLANADIYEQPK